MNDLVTKSFLDYVELKKQSMKEMEFDRPDLEVGRLDPADESNLSKFFQELNAVKSEVEEITNLLLDLKNLNEDSKSTHSTKVLKGIKDRINSDVVTVLRKAKVVKSRLESLDKSNMANRSLSVSYKEGSPIDSIRVSLTDGLRIKLKEMMHDFQALREQILKDHKEGLKRRYYNATGEHPSEEVIEKMVSGGGQERVFEGKEDIMMENRQKHEALKEIERSLTELHHVFVDMAVLVEKQGDEINNIEENVARGRTYINGGTNGLQYAKQMKKKSHWEFWIGIVLIILLIVFVATLAS